MSSFSRGGAGPGRLQMRATDTRILASWYQSPDPGPYQAQDSVWAVAPRGLSCGVAWGQYDRYAGSNRWRFINGVTFDNASARLGGVLVRGYRTATHEVVGEVTSDAGGNYALATPYADGHYLVAYKNGAPDTAGTTANTIIPV